MATENKNLSVYDKNTIPNAKALRFGIVVSEWNAEITEGLFDGAKEALIDCGALEENITRWNVPGSFELTFGSKKLATTRDVDAIIAIGRRCRCSMTLTLIFQFKLPTPHFQQGINNFLLLLHHFNQSIYLIVFFIVT